MIYANCSRAVEETIASRDKVTFSRSICVERTRVMEIKKRERKRDRCRKWGEKERAAASQIDNPFPAVEK